MIQEHSCNFNISIGIIDIYENIVTLNEKYELQLDILNSDKNSSISRDKKISSEIGKATFKDFTFYGSLSKSYLIQV